MDYCWMENHNEMMVGFHTRKICERIDKAIEDYRNGISSFLLISVPPRHGKSQITSRYLPPHFMAEFPGSEVMSVSYGTDLATSFSEQARAIVGTHEFKELYPKTYLPFDSSAKSDWKLNTEDQMPSSLKALGLTAGLNGKGYNLGILDDYLKNRKEAESADTREKIWQAFINDFLTRRAPVSITIIVATQWNVDDINGRIRVKMRKDDNFPKFDVISFPAKAKDYKGEGEYETEYLFQKRFGKKYYLEQYATLGKYNAAALLDCNPRIRGGSVLSTDHIEWVDPDDPRIIYLKEQKYRVWDLAHTAKEKAKDDPDYTSGTKLLFTKPTKEDPIPHLWVFDVVRCRENSPKRDKIIKKTAENDGHFVKQGVETSLDSKDAYYHLRSAMPDINWNKINIAGKGDKLVKAGPLEPIFEAPGHVHVIRGDWNEDWLDEVEQFKGDGKLHDDQIDNLSSGYIIAVDKVETLTDEDMQALREINSQ